MIMSFALSLIPGLLSFLKLPIYNWAAKTCFRILSRSFSGVIQFHNREFRPKSDGICVANHTTPIDVVVLSCDRSYALVIFNLSTAIKFCSTWEYIFVSIMDQTTEPFL